MSRVETEEGVYERCSCDARLVRRQNRKTGNWFWGCSTYPACKWTFPITTVFTEDGDPMPEWDDGEVSPYDLGIGDVGDR